jgi:hypothetical protein
MTRGQANVVRAFSIWTVYVWVTRLWNIWGDDQSVAFKLVHTFLAVVSVALAVAAWVVVSRVRRKRLAEEAAAAGEGRTPVEAGADR